MLQHCAGMLCAGDLELLRQLFFKTLNPRPMATPGTPEADRKNAELFCRFAEDGVHLAQEHVVYLQWQGFAASAVQVAVAAAWLQEMEQLLHRRQERCAALGLHAALQGGGGGAAGVVAGSSAGSGVVV